MKNVLSPHLSLTSFCLQIDGKLRRFFTASLSFSLLEQGKRNVLSEEKGWQAAAAAVEEGAPIDLGVPKARPEWLLAGSVQSREPVETVECAIRVDKQERRFLVAGDRIDNGLNLSSPLPFTDMPLVWSRAFGGKGVTENPIGRGVEKENGVVRLPNVTEKVAGALLEKTPVCPGPMQSLYRHFSNLGTFDTAWLKNNWPGPPSDFDWSFFNLAQGSQRRDEAFVGNESITLTNLHPEHQVLQSSLPGLRLRLFLNLGSEDTPLWQEVETFADTVWLFPNQATGMQLWHASCPTSDEKSSEICQVAALYESCEGPRKTLPELFADLEAAQAQETLEVAVEEPEVIAEPQEEPEGGLSDAAMAIPEIKTPDIPQPDMSRMPEGPSLPDDPAELLDIVMKDTRENISEVLDEVNPVLVEQGFEPITAEQFLAQMDKQHAVMRQMLATSQHTEAEILQQAGISQKQYDDILKAAELAPPQSASFATREAYEAALQAYGDEFASLTGASPKIREQLVSQMRLIDEMQTNPDVVKSLQPKEPTLEEALEKAGFMNADAAKVEAAFEMLDSMPPGDAAMMGFMEEFGAALGVDPKIMTDELTKQLSSMRSMTYKHDSSQSALDELFSNFPEDQKFLPILRQHIEDAKIGTAFDLKSLAQDAGITNEELLEAITAIDPLPIDPPMPPTPENAIQDDTMAQDGEDSSSAENPESATDKEISKDEIPQGEPVLDYSGQNLAGMNFAGHVLAFARFDDANLNQADFSGANLEGASFTNADLSNANLSGANLENADFTEAKLEGTNFSTGNADGATFANVVLDKTLFFKTHLSGASFTGCSAKGTDFSGCTLERASLTESILDGARFADAKLGQIDFTACTLARADFSRADMEGARMYDNTLDCCVFFKARAQGSSWLRCRGESLNLREAELAKATFDDCTLVRADLGAVGARECRFHSCDLHGADLRHADFLNGALRDCKLGGANLSGASLFACDLLYAAVNEETKFEGANIERTRLALGDL